ncbi:hypothetical protein NXX85_03955 [Bacteroides caccae]|nr:hypothetical protein NXX85_03955 [Bacteroides caccae]
MEDFLKFLLIAGVILVGIFKEVNKNSKSKKAKNNRPVPPTPSPVEVAPDATPMPEAWGRPRSLEELFQPIPAEQRTRKPKVRQQESKPKKKKKKYPLPPLSPTVPHRMNETAGKVPTITLPTIHMTTKKTSPFILLKKPGALLSGEKSFNGSIDKCQV